MNSFNTIFVKFSTLLHNTDPDLSYFDLSYVFIGHNDSVERGPTVSHSNSFFTDVSDIGGDFEDDDSGSGDGTLIDNENQGDSLLFSSYYKTSTYF